MYVWRAAVLSGELRTRAHLRACVCACIRTCSGEGTLRLHDVLIHKADIIQAILDPMYFLSTIQQCEENLKTVRYRDHFLDEMADSDLGKKVQVFGSFDL